MKIGGKQIADDTIKQANLDILTNTIVNPNDATNKEYVEDHVSSIVNNLNVSNLNYNLITNDTSIDPLASDRHIIEYPISAVRVNINGIEVNIGGDSSPYDGYFSPNGTTIRKSGEEQKGDKLYWNTLNYDLDSNDEADFIYMVKYNHVTLIPSTTVLFDERYDDLVVEYIGNQGESATVIIDGTSFLVGVNLSNNFVFDMGGGNEYEFTSDYETFNVTVNTVLYDIIFDVNFIFSISIATAEISTFVTVDPSVSFNITANTSVEYNWGDGNTDTITSGSVANHTYTSAVEHTITATAFGVTEIRCHSNEIGRASCRERV